MRVRLLWRSITDDKRGLVMFGLQQPLHFLSHFDKQASLRGGHFAYDGHQFDGGGAHFGVAYFEYEAVGRHGDGGAVIGMTGRRIG